MLVKVAILIELIAVLICVHRVYGKKFKISIGMIITISTMYVIMEIVNRYELSSTYALISYMFLFFYCILQFRKKILPTIIGIILSILIVAVIQFVCILIFVFVNYNNEVLVGLLSNVVVLLTVVFIFPKIKVDKFYERICEKHWLQYVVLLFCSFVLIFSIVSGKINRAIDIGLFMFGIPAIIIIMLLIRYWQKSETNQRVMEEEIKLIADMQYKYDDLIENVKINQHGLKNHMMALEAASKMYDTDEQIYQMETKYYNEMKKHNKYNNILLIGNKILGGFLYSKIREIEEMGIEVHYTIESAMDDKLSIPYYFLIEILGILFDNAMEANLELTSEKAIYFNVRKKKEIYIITISNKFPEISYDIINNWFKKGKTTKGGEHGIGLYRVKKLCKEYNCSIGCKNKEVEGVNWIVFELNVK